MFKNPGIYFIICSITTFVICHNFKSMFEKNCFIPSYMGLKAMKSNLALHVLNHHQYRT